MFSVLAHFFGHKCFTEPITFLCGLEYWVQPLWIGYDPGFRQKNYTIFADPCQHMLSQFTVAICILVYDHLSQIM